MAKRIGLSNKIRFEVFKRDSFTCQYCGSKSPDVVLNVDHIKPVKLGGDNDILNLITSCFKCNNGKKAIPLDDKSEITKQRAQLEELEERRYQLELLLKWRNELIGFKNSEADRIAEYISNYVQPLTLNQDFKVEIKKWIKKYNIDLILECIDESASRYIVNKDGNPEMQSCLTFIDKIGGILFFKSKPPLNQKVAWVRIVASKKFTKDGWLVENLIWSYVNALQDFGWDEYRIVDDLQNELMKLVNQKEYYSHFESSVEHWIQNIKSWEHADRAPF